MKENIPTTTAALTFILSSMPIPLLSNITTAPMLP